MFRRAVCDADTKHFDLTKTFEPDDLTAFFQTRRHARPQAGLVDVNLPVRFQPGQKMPAERAPVSSFQSKSAGCRNRPVADSNRARETRAAFPRNGHYWLFF